MTSRLQRLPAELREEILSELPNKDIKSLRLTCTSFRDWAQLRLSRVFLSAHKLDIEVFRAIANHDYFRLQVTEIIWDDARFDEEEYDSTDAEQSDDSEQQALAPYWYRQEIKEDISELIHRLNSRPNPDYPDKTPNHIVVEDKLEHQLRLSDSFAHYLKLRGQQDQVLEAKTDENAFRYGLEQFPRLAKITVTPAAHGYLFLPLYETPTIRAFPKNFSYPIPRGWPTLRQFRSNQEHMPLWTETVEKEKEAWHAVRIICRVLAEQQDSPITQLVFDASQLPTGINATIFSERCEEYDYLAEILRQPGFARLDLAISVDREQNRDWGSLRSGLLRRALMEARDIQHISLTTDIDVFERSSSERPEGFRWLGGPVADLVLLRTIFPVEIWHNLQHFGLSNFLVQQNDLILFLAAMPPTLSYEDLLTAMRDELDWRHRPASKQPKVLIATQVHELKAPGRAARNDAGVMDFLYGDGQIPFCQGALRGVAYDIFEPQQWDEQ